VMDDFELWQAQVTAGADASVAAFDEEAAQALSELCGLADELTRRLIDNGLPVATAASLVIAAVGGHVVASVAP
jgi:hypothetical protein